MNRLNPSFLAIACASLLASATVWSAQPGMDQHDRWPGMGMPRGAALTPAQEQKAFALRHAAEPALFEQAGQVRKAHEALQELGEAAQFDEARASAAADALGGATAALALSRTRLASQVHALLTPEQRADLAQRRH